MGMELDAGGPVARQRKMPSVRFVEKATGMLGLLLKDLAMSTSVANALSCANQFSIKRNVEEEPANNSLLLFRHRERSSGISTNMLLGNIMRSEFSL
jgi:hypothetical protein